MKYNNYNTIVYIQHFYYNYNIIIKYYTILIIIFFNNILLLKIHFYNIKKIIIFNLQHFILKVIISKIISNYNQLFINTQPLKSSVIIYLKRKCIYRITKSHDLYEYIHLLRIIRIIKITKIKLLYYPKYRSIVACCIELICSFLINLLILSTNFICSPAFSC